MGMAEKQEKSDGRPALGKGKGRGFASMDEAKQREIASKGGKASALGNTANRGFASMDSAKQREISRKGGQASHRNRGQQRVKKQDNQSLKSQIQNIEKKTGEL